MERKIGQNTFATTYMGILQDGTRIAVKKLGENSAVTPDKQFRKEVDNLFWIEHKNIVKLVASCCDKQKKVVEQNGTYIVVNTLECFLCYEYMPKGSLDKYIYGDSSKSDWKMRFNIIKGICQGLHFLHRELETPIVHLNLSPEVILLDDNMVPKLSDFALSKILGKDLSPLKTESVVGKYGYMAPEYVYAGEVSTSTDIYNLGLIIIEIATGEKSNGSNDDKSARSFIERVRQHWTFEYILLNYPSVDANSLEQIKACIETGLKCVEVDQMKRPSIADIIRKLNA
jgi:disease resistance protein RPM1